MSRGNDKQNLKQTILRVSPIEQLAKENRQKVLATLTPGEFGHVLMQYHKWLLPEYTEVAGFQLAQFEAAMKLFYDDKKLPVPLFIVTREQYKMHIMLAIEKARDKITHEVTELELESIQKLRAEAQKWQDAYLSVNAELGSVKAELATYKEMDSTMLEGLDLDF